MGKWVFGWEEFGEMKEVIKDLTLIPLNELVNKKTQSSKHFIFSENINPYNLYLYQHYKSVFLQILLSNHQFHFQ